MTDSEFLANLEKTVRAGGAVVGCDKETFLRLIELAKRAPRLGDRDVTATAPCGCSTTYMENGTFGTEFCAEHR